MSNVSKLIRQAYYDALNGEISVNVYKEDVPQSENGHHVIISLESETDGSNKARFVNNVVIKTEVVGIYSNSVDPDEVDDIDDEIRAILKPSVTALLQIEGIQLTNIKASDSTFIPEDDGVKRYYRKITRWTQRVSHT
jgi:hypothetical protein